MGVRPVKLYGSFGEFSEWLRNFSKVLDEPVIISCDAQERSYLTSSAGRVPFLDSLNLLGIRLHSGTRNDVSEVLDFMRKKNALLGFKLEVRVPESFKYQLHVVNASVNITCVHNDIVDVR